ncbi:HAD family hydrolase [Planotetraspora mira]|jgi:putative hydrolase of the HAD superfamily|uniref:Haloacid dehalogenase n=1 Tax=Planotetraspora mira TaxID=58121 RepID=A0A8J3TK49_9ACTN|nr:HAD family phosphatase [Planotetraspora mira]GII27928.1 haloacid dehalogenase [Planotetraspora mira]
MRHVLFDYGNVICLPQSEADAARLAQGIPGFEERYWDLRLDFDRGTLDDGAYWSAVYGRPVAGAELDQAIALDVASWSRPNEETLAIVDELAAGGVPMALLSNAPVSIADGVDLLPFMAPIRPRFFSGRMGLVKPDQEIYLRVAESMGVAPGDIVFVDDRLENIEGAERAGMTGVHFRDAATLRDDLKLAL